MTRDFEELLEAAKSGNEAAFVQLFRSVQPLLLRYLTTMSGGGIAEDVASETWMSVVRGLPGFEGDETGFRSWVFTIARSRLTDAWRRTPRIPTPVDADQMLTDRPDGTDVPAHVERIFSTEAALSLVARLPRDQAEAVFLRHVVGLEVAQAAKVLGKRPGALRVAVHRGLKKLADLVDPAGTTAEATVAPLDRTRGDAALSQSHRRFS